MPRKNQPGCPCGCENTTDCCKVKCKICQSTSVVDPTPINCQIAKVPQTDLIITGFGSQPLILPYPGWSSLFGAPTDFSWAFTCGTNTAATLTFTTFAQGLHFFCSNFSSNVGGGQFGAFFALTSYTLSPFSLTFDGRRSCANFETITLTAKGNTSTSVPLMCQTFCISSCLGSVPAQTPITVTVFANQGGAQLTSGTIASGNCIRLLWNGAPGSYYVTVTVDGSECFADTLNLNCSDTTNIALSADCLCFPDGEPPDTLDATWVWSYTDNGMTHGPFTDNFTMSPDGPDDYYTGGGFFAPFTFNFAVDFSQCQMTFMPGLAGGRNCGVFSFSGSCDPLNLGFVVPPTLCPAFGQPPPSISGTLTVTS